MSNHNRGDWSIFAVGLDFADGLDDVQPTDDATKDATLSSEAGVEDRATYTCLPVRCGAASSVTKNCEPFVSGPLFAMTNSPALSTSHPGPSNLSSANVPPNMLSPPVPFRFVKSPPWIMKPSMTRWIGEPR